MGSCGIFVQGLDMTIVPMNGYKVALGLGFLGKAKSVSYLSYPLLSLGTS